MFLRKQYKPCAELYCTMSFYISHLNGGSPSEDLRVESDGKKWWYGCTKCLYRSDRKYHAKMHFMRCHVNGGRGCNGRRKYKCPPPPAEKKLQHETPLTSQCARTLQTSTCVLPSMDALPLEPPSHCYATGIGMKYTDTKRTVRENMRYREKLHARSMMMCMTFRDGYIETCGGECVWPSQDKTCA